MNVIIAEAIDTHPIVSEDGVQLYQARELDESSEKFQAINTLLGESPVSYFLELNDRLSHLLGITTPFVFVTDWTDPRELIGLRLETKGQLIDYPDLCFLGFSTDWDDFNEDDIKHIFAHELSHMWLSRMGFDFDMSQSNKFHTCTAITDPYMAFSEGFAEHLEIVTKDIMGITTPDGELWDHAYDVSAWLCHRDAQLRVHAVKNNRFIYHTAKPLDEDFDTYQHLHMAHITSSAFTPERLKNGLQMVSSEGVIASFFYQIYAHDALKNAKADAEVYDRFGVEYNEIKPITNLYLKILYAMSKIDLKKISLMTDFVTSYCTCFPNERSDMIDVFSKVTHFCTVDHSASHIFGKMYRVGRQGNIEHVQECRQAVRELQSDLKQSIIESNVGLDDAVYESIWLEGDEYITPVPWQPDERVQYRFDINAATEVDFYAIKRLSYDQCCELVKIREAKQGFKSIDEFKEEVHRFIRG